MRKKPGYERRTGEEKTGNFGRDVGLIPPLFLIELCSSWVLFALEVRRGSRDMTRRVGLLLRGKACGRLTARPVVVVTKAERRGNLVLLEWAWD